MAEAEKDGEWKQGCALLAAGEVRRLVGRPASLLPLESIQSCWFRDALQED